MSNHTFPYKALAAFSLALTLCGPCQALAASSVDEIPLAARLVLTKAGDLMNKNEYDRAIKTLTEFQARGGATPEPDDPDPKGYHHFMVCFALGNCYLIQKQYTPAATAYRNGLKRNPNHCASWLNLANALYESERFGAAGECFAKGYDTADEKKPDRLYFSAASFYMDGQYDRSIAAFERLYKNHGPDIQAKWKESFVHVLLAAEQPRRALPIVRELAQEHTGEDRIRWQETLLSLYLQLNMREKALDYAMELTRDNPTLPKWWKALAHAQLNFSQYQQALTSMTVYAWLTPLNDEEQKLLADLNLQLGIPVKAAPLYETLLNRKPDKRLLKSLALACQQLDRPDRVLSYMERFKTGDKDAELLMLKGDLLYAMGRYQEAALSYRRSAEGKDKGAGRAWLMAGYAALRINDLDASRHAFKQAADDPKQKSAALAALKQID